MALAVIRCNPALRRVEAPLENLALEWHGGQGPNEQSMASGPSSAHPEVGLQRHFHGGELEAEIDAVLPFAVEIIHD
jgi:hypothetical protein